LICKEALEESGMEYNEQVWTIKFYGYLHMHTDTRQNQYFLVHQQLDKVMQQQLFDRTKRIRGIYSAGSSSK
jgi:hypothetical protein